MSGKTTIRLGISSCLLGNKVRFDGDHKRDHFITDTLEKYVDWVPVCPEAECGLGIPREPMRLVGNPSCPRLIGVQSGQDHTEGLLRWARSCVAKLQKKDLWGFIFKARSPSCGRQRVKVFSKKVRPGNGAGIFAGIFMEHFPFLPVEDEEGLHDPERRENFIERIFTYRRWRKMQTERKTRSNLIRFHSRHKLIILAHSPKYHRTMGNLLSREGVVAKELYAEYQRLLTETLRLKTTISKNTHVLQHIAGHIQKQLSADEKQELGEAIDSYRQGDLPSLVPITLLNHYLRKYDQSYLKEQYYLQPHPIELQLRNHV